MTQTISNKYLTLSVKAMGAEMVQLQKDKVEYLWQADANYWGRHAPILFPIVGRLLDDEYIYKGQRYAMGQHGFARDQPFKLVEKAKDSLTFELVSNEELYKIYPFDFVLQLKYSLVDSSVHVTYLVKNPSAQDDLLFSIGAHPAFNCPVENGHRRDKYQLQFDLETAPVAYLAENAYYTGETMEVMSKEGVLKISDSLFDRGSLTFRPNSFGKASLVHRPSGKKYLSMSFENYPYLAIWSKDRSSPFICIEPWHGVADSVSHNKELSQKAGIIRLAPEQVFTCAYQIDIF